MALRIFVADDHEIVRRGLCALLQSKTDWLICGEAGDGRLAVEQVAQLKPDIVVLDIGMPGLNGLEVTRQILKTNPKIKVLILTLHDSDHIVREVLNAGARGFLRKSDAARDLVDAVEALRRDQTYFTSTVSEMVLEAYLKRSEGLSVLPVEDRLTPREREVVQLVVEGKSTKEVATALGLSVKTAETHRSNIMRKLDIHSVSDLVIYAIRNSIVYVTPEIPPASESAFSASP
jgi:DNA-binding NarL/FixJ family response regulator